MNTYILYISRLETKYFDLEHEEIRKYICIYKYIDDVAFTNVFSNELSKTTYVTGSRVRCSIEVWRVGRQRRPKKSKCIKNTNAHTTDDNVWRQHLVKAYSKIMYNSNYASRRLLASLLNLLGSLYNPLGKRYRTTDEFINKTRGRKNVVYFRLPLAYWCL